MIHAFKKRRKQVFFPTQWANSVSAWCLGVCSPTGTISIANTATPTEGGMSLKIDINETRLESLVNRQLGRRTTFTTAERKAIQNIIGSSVDQKLLKWGDSILSFDVETLRNDLELVELATVPADAEGDELDPYIPQEDAIPLLDGDDVETDESKSSRVGTSKLAAREDHRHPVCVEQGLNPSFRDPEQTGDETSVMPIDELPEGVDTHDDVWYLGIGSSQTNRGDGFNILLVSRILYDEDEGVHYLFFREASVSRNGNFTSIGAELGATAIMA